MARYLGHGSGRDGVVNLNTYTPVNVSCSGTLGSTSLSATGSFSAGDRLFIIQSRGTGVGSYEDNQVLSYVTGTITLVHPLENNYTDSGNSQAQVIVVKEASSVTGSFTVPAWDGDKGGLFVMACSGTFAGTVNADGKGYRGGRSGANPDVDNQDGEQGEGTAGSQSRSSSANGNGGGGGTERSTNEQGNGGGGGGHAGSGTDGAKYISSGGGLAGSGGSSVGSADLSSGLFFGGGGGGGGFGDFAPSPTGNGNGGNGGGIIVIYTNELSSSAQLTASGNQGQSGNGDQGAGGGGAGGTIFIKAKSADIGTIFSLGTSAAGGTSGGGGNGSAGRIRVEACSITGTTSPTASESEGGHSWCGLLGGMI